MTCDKCGNEVCGRHQLCPECEKEWQKYWDERFAEFVGFNGRRIYHEWLEMEA